MFITIDGIDGCGKSTQISQLRANLEARGHIVSVFSDLGSSQLGITARDLINSSSTVDPLIDALLIYAARLTNIESNILPALSRGEVVLADRFSLSTFVYNIAGRGISTDVYDTVEGQISKKLKPSLSLFIDVDVDICLSRIEERPPKPEKYESYGKPFFENAQKEFLSCSEAGLAIRIDGSGSIEDIEERIILTVSGHLGL